MSLSDDVQLNKAEKAWKPAAKKASRGRSAEEGEDADDPEQAKTQELFKRLRSILNKLTPQKFQELMKQVMELKIDTEERLKGAIDLIFEKAISEPNFSVAYANMCRCLMGVSRAIVSGSCAFIIRSNDDLCFVPRVWATECSWWYWGTDGAHLNHCSFSVKHFYDNVIMPYNY